MEKKFSNFLQSSIILHAITTFKYLNYFPYVAMMVSGYRNNNIKKIVLKSTSGVKRMFLYSMKSSSIPLQLSVIAVVSDS